MGDNQPLNNKHNFSISDYIKGFKSKALNYTKSYVSQACESFANAITKGDYNRLKSENHKLKDQVQTDNLTGLYNKKKLKNDLEQLINQYIRHRTPFSLVMIDIDHFKYINDTFGHETGDKILENIGDICKNKKRQEDGAYRYGGEEFCLVLPNTPEIEAKKATERLKEYLSNCSFENLPQVKISGGVTSYREGETACDLIRRADKAMYEAKRKGRNRILTYQNHHK